MILFYSFKMILNYLYFIKIGKRKTKRKTNFFFYILFLPLSPFPPTDLYGRLSQTKWIRHKKGLGSTMTTAPSHPITLPTPTCNLNHLQSRPPAHSVVYNPFSDLCSLVPVSLSEPTCTHDNSGRPPFFFWL